MRVGKWFSILNVSLITAACGSSGSDEPQYSLPELEGNTGAVSALFSPTTPHYFIYNTQEYDGDPGSSSMEGTLSNYTQDADGIVTRISTSSGDVSFSVPADNKLPLLYAYELDEIPDLYSPVTKETDGNSAFAMGRWAVGEADLLGQPLALQVQAFRDYPDYVYLSGVHYLLANQAASFPVSDVLTCDSGHFTSGTYYRGASSRQSLPVEITGVATLSFDGDGAHFSIDLQGVVEQAIYHIGDPTMPQGVQIANVNFTGTIMSPTNTYLFSNAAVMVADGGSGNYLLAGHYTIEDDFGVQYKGMMVFICD
jgi:hypothetical protein